MIRIFSRLTLLCGGVMLFSIGAFLLVAPRMFLAASHVFVESDPGLMSELSAPTGMLILTGGFMILAAFKMRFAQTGLVIGAIIYGSYGVSRLIGMSLHGLPPEGLLTATKVELGIAVLLISLRAAMGGLKQKAVLGNTATHAAA